MTNQDIKTDKTHIFFLSTTQKSRLKQSLALTSSIVNSF